MIKFNKGFFMPTFSRVIKAINNRSRKVLFQNIKITVVDNKIQFMATNSTQQTVRVRDFKADDRFTAIVNAKSFEQIIRKFNRSNLITLETDGKSVTIKDDGLSFDIPALPPENFPILEDITDWSCEFLINRTVIDQINKQLLFIADKEDRRTALKGIHWHSDPDDTNRFIAVATDGIQLGKVTINLGSPIENLEPVIIPREFWHLVKGFFYKNQPVKVSLSKKFIRMEQHGMEVISRLIDMRYPYYQNIFPQQNNDYFYLNRQALIDEINEVSSVFDDKKYMPMSFNFSTDKVILEAHDSKSGSVTAKVASAEVRVLVNNNTIGKIATRFNSRLLLDILSASDDDRIVFRLDAKYPETVAIIEELHSDDTVFLLNQLRC